MHQSLPGTRLKGLWCNNSLSFNLIFLFSFPLRLFVCSHDFGCCLSSGGMYTCSSQMLVHLSALGCFWWSAMLLFSSSFFFIRSYRVFLSVDFLKFLFLVSPLTHLNFRCLSVQSLIELAVGPRSFISVGGCQAVAGFICHPVGSARGADALWPLYWAVWPSFLCMLWWSLSLISVFLEAALYLFPYSEHNKGLLLDSPNWSWTHSPIGLLFCFFLLSGCMEREYCTFSTMWLCSPYLML